jgi:hypothetical protein
LEAAKKDGNDPSYGASRRSLKRAMPDTARCPCCAAPKSSSNQSLWVNRVILDADSDFRFTPLATRSLRRTRRRLGPMLLKKGKNEPIEIFACAPVETGFS